MKSKRFVVAEQAALAKDAGDEGKTIAQVIAEAINTEFPTEFPNVENLTYDLDLRFRGMRAYDIEVHTYTCSEPSIIIDLNEPINDFDGFCRAAARFSRCPNVNWTYFVGDRRFDTSLMDALNYVPSTVGVPSTEGDALPSKGVYIPPKEQLELRMRVRDVETSVCRLMKYVKEITLCVLLSLLSFSGYANGYNCTVLENDVERLEEQLVSLENMLPLPLTVKELISVAEFYLWAGKIIGSASRAVITDNEADCLRHDRLVLDDIDRVLKVQRAAIEDMEEAKVKKASKKGGKK